MVCEFCGKETTGTRFCSSKCSGKYGSFRSQINLYGEFKIFLVRCDKCKKEFEVTEREKLFPQKIKYFCSSKCSHSRKQTQETKEKISGSLKKVFKENPQLAIAPKTRHKGANNSQWKGGKTKLTCEHCGKDIFSYDKKRRFHRECYMKHAGGYREGSGRGRHCKYYSPIAGNVFLDSSYELKYAEYLDKHNIQWERNTKRFPYEYCGKTYNYTPDFFLIEENVFVEIKGYKTDRDVAKWSDFPGELRILMFEELKEMGVLQKNM